MTHPYGRRTSPRVGVTMPAQVHLAHGEYSGTVTNLSVGGVFVQCEAEVNPPCAVMINIAISDGEKPRFLEVLGTVVHTRQGGFGIKFDTLPPATLNRLLRVVTRTFTLEPF